MVLAPKSSGPRLSAIPSLAARSALQGGRVDRDFLPDSRPTLPDFLSDGEDFGAKLLGVRDLDPLAVLDDDDAIGGPHPVGFLDQEEIGPQLEPVAGIDPLG